MDASSNFSPPLDYGYAGPPPVLVVASSDQARARAVATIEGGGFRTAHTSVENALDRLALQAAASALWLELDEDPGAVLDQVLDRAEAEAASGRLPVVVSLSPLLIDQVTARLAASAADLLVDASPAERLGALALATAKRRAPASLHDVATEPSAVRLRQLSDEVSRIAATLARLSVGPGSPAANRNEAPVITGEAPPVSVETIRQVIRARRLRARFFDEELFADPAWDMLLDLLQAEIAQHRVPVSSLCIAAAVPATTALRWIKTMTDAGLFRRRADPHDGRRIFIELAPEASQAMRRYFGEVGAMAVI
jgi:DNA-binding MarR family transcriptional regulator